MTPDARRLLRSIALGLPILGASALSSCTSWGGGPCPETTERFEVTSEQLADPEGCQALCDELQRIGGRPSPNFIASSLNSCDPLMDDGGLAIECTYFIGCGGRPPAGLMRPKLAPGLDATARFLAAAAHMERASVPAFVDLRADLLRHGAPAPFAPMAARAARDEVRHANALEQLARAVGVTPPPIERTETTVRTMRQMCEDNAAVGCVGEAHAALVAAHQAAHAPAEPLRRIFGTIARDEARHALLSFAIHDWAVARLPARQARQLEERRREAHHAFVRVVAEDVDPLVTETLGVPNPDRSASLADALA